MKFGKTVKCNSREIYFSEFLNLVRKFYMPGFICLSSYLSKKFKIHCNMFRMESTVLAALTSAISLKIMYTTSCARAPVKCF